MIEGGLAGVAAAAWAAARSLIEWARDARDLALLVDIGRNTHLLVLAAPHVPRRHFRMLSRRHDAVLATIIGDGMRSTEAQVGAD